MARLGRAQPFKPLIQAFRGSSGTIYTQALNATTTPNATIARQTAHALAATTTPNATVVRANAKVVNANSTPNATIVRSTGKIVKIDTTPNATIARSTAKALAASSTPNATITRSTAKTLNASSTPNATMVETKQTLYHQTVSASTTPNASMSETFITAAAELPPHRGVIITGKPMSRTGPASSGGGGYAAKAVHFSSGASLWQDSSAITSSSAFTLSGWFNFADISVSPFLFAWNPTSGAFHSSTYFGWINIGFSFTSDVGCNFRNSAFTSNFLINSDDGLWTTNAWHHIAMSMDTNHAAGLKLGQLYVDGVSVLDAALTEDVQAAFNIGAVNGSIGLVAGNPYHSAPTTMDTCDVQVWVGTRVDLSNSSNLAKLISAGKPVDPATATAAFGQQTILFSGDHTAFLTNQGSGGVFTLTGSLTDASTHP